MTSQKHCDLVVLGAKWLRKQGFGVVATEVRAIHSREEADVVGFRSNCSAIIEVKVSKADFRADAKKPERTGAQPGLGVYRFYLSPVGVIGREDLPPGWGLIHEVNGKLVDVMRPKGNIWPSYGHEHWREWQHLACPEAERSVLYSIARRIANGKPLLR